MESVPKSEMPRQKASGGYSLKCEICGSESDAAFCTDHSKAFSQIRDGFQVWKKALGIDWEAYLHRISTNPNTGRWAREVAEHLLKSSLQKH